MLTCPNCGKDNPDGARFCNACAAPLAAEAAASREERKVVTVLFADVVGFTSRSEQLDPEDVRAFLSPYYARLRSELERFGGTVEKFIGDAVMALFGAPIAHEDDPERAVRAALAIKEALADLSDQEGRELHVRMGITSGEALVSLGARPDEGEGMAAGDVVNTAARLQAAAPTDGILVDDATYRATSQVIEYVSAPPVEAKGKAEPVPAWQALHARARFGVDTRQIGSSPLVGRERELAALTSALDRVRQERSAQLVTLVGVPGIGKSRLAYELFQTVEEDSELISWRQGRSLPYGEGVTYWAISEMTKAQAGILETDPAEDVEEKLRRTVAEIVSDPAEARWVEMHLRPLTGLGQQSELGGDRRAESFGAWRRFFEALAERRPLVLVFEDLHWADDDLLDFVDHLVDWASGVPLLVVCTARPELLERRPHWGGGKLNALILSLAPLSDSDTARLISALPGQAVMPAETQAALLDNAGGNPLYAEQFVRMLDERGDTDLPLPETVQGVIAARLDTLAPEDKALLQDAAVFGKVFWLGALATIAGAERVQTEERLHVLERKEFVQRSRQSSVAGESEISFSHLHVRDVAYGQIPRAVRAEKHRRAAEWIEALGRAEDHAEMLAHHYLTALELGRAAGRDDKAVEERARLALREAGDRAFALNAFVAAARFFGSALELWPLEDAERPDLLFRYGKTLRISEEGGEEVLVEARDGLLAAGDEATAAEAEGLLADLAWRQGQPERLAEHLAHAAALVRDAKSSGAKAHVLATMSRFQMLSDENEEAIRVGREALLIAEELGLEELCAFVLNSVGSARANEGDLGGLADLERSLEIALAINSPESIRSYNNLASVYEQVGEVAKAAELYAEGVRISERLGNPPIARTMRLWLLDNPYRVGDWNQALQLANEFIAEVDAGKPHHREGVARCIRSRVRLARGEESAALEEASVALERARVSGDSQILPELLLWYGVVLLETGRTDAAAKIADEWKAAPATNRLGREWADAAVLFAGLGQSEELLSVLANFSGNRWVDAAKLYVQGEFEAAADLYAEIDTLPYEAFARLQAAKARAGEGKRAEADAQLQQALAFYRSVGATRYIAEGEAFLAASA
jgi:class 3 adenylate cyclase/tetratricopeptide (TPR) repeat protein